MKHVRMSAPALAALAVVLAACGDATAPRTVAESPTFDRNESNAARGVFHRYVAMGTSVSMGWAADGAIAATQDQAWPLQLARRANRTMTAPFLAMPGCRSPLASPLVSFRRLSGESIAVPLGSLSCAPLLSGVTLPVANTAINSARAFDALNSTPERFTDPANDKLYDRILPPNTTQVRAMELQNPKFVSVEFGGNEVLGAIGGLVIPGVTVVPVQGFAPDYGPILDRVAATVNTGAVLVGLVDDAADFPVFRRGSEVWAQKDPLFTAFNVVVSVDCALNPNLLAVPFTVVAKVAEGLQRRQAGPGAGSAQLSCADRPGTVDYVLTPADVALLNSIINGIDRYIKSQADFRGWAYFRLEALYGIPGLKAPFNVIQLMTSSQPYGPYMSLDGVHPSALGQTVLTDAAARAINARYRLGLPVGIAAILAER